MSLDWGPAYAKCPKWKDAWRGTQQGPWPAGYQKSHGKLRNQGLWCVPTDMMAKVMKEAHSFFGHLGGERLLYHTARQFLFTDEEVAKKMADKV